MRLAALLRYRRGLLMPLGSSSSNSGTHSLKRSFARPAYAHAQPQGSESYEADSPRPGKAQKRSGSPAPTDMPPTSSSRGGGFGLRGRQSGGGGPSARGHGRHQSASATRSSRRGPQRSSAPALDGPLHDQKYLDEQAKSIALSQNHRDNPKSVLSNFLGNLGKKTNYTRSTGVVGPDKIPVTRVQIVIELADGVSVVGIGDDIKGKDAEKLSALHAIIQLRGTGAMDQNGRPPAALRTQLSGAPADKTTATLSDGTVVQFELARQFVDYYCRRFKFGKEDVTLEEVKSGGRRVNSNWEAVMTVGGRRIGIGSGSNKKAANTACYLDVVQYLESCDANLWKEFVDAAKTGKDLGMAAKINFQLSDRVDDEIRELCRDIKQSTLYDNRPSKIAGGSGPEVITRPSRPPPSSSFLDGKSTRLSDRRKQYLENPALEKMRQTRATLPVSTRAEEMLKHIDENEVTICMAATGSGKTTQIPQLILDHWIEQGKGAHCNIVCTQPRRLAAISVADRVAKERGETVGRGSVGYQVRFEQKLPEEHGSITFCTTGIFLKRMQSALLEGGSAGGQSLDDVTHVIVDEVHERDVDTDLLLVVLKRLLADRKAKNKPIKVVLMSATIDPTLFQKYFPDINGQPANVTEIPGRSFPVTKHFLDEFVPKLAQAPGAKWAFQERSVERYLKVELDPPLLRQIGIAHDPSAGQPRGEDLDMPAPLVALTVSHVLRESEDGHVLVFLPGWDDITAVQKALLDRTRPFGVDFGDVSKYSIHLLHSTIPLAEQQVIFEPPPSGVRRIILATNIAETSITIPDVVYVVDTAKVKEQRYDPDRHMSSLVSAWVGSSNLNQRAGRAGRHRPGDYYGVLSQRRAEQLDPYQTVEMKRVDLSNVVMHVKALNFPGMAVEDVLAATIEPPAADRVAAAMADLKMVGALDEEKNLTALGRVLLQLPVETQMGRLVLFGSFFRCLDSALTLAAILTNRDPFLSPMHLKQEAQAVKNSWSPPDFRSDALATLRAYNAWWAMQGNGEYVSANRFLSDNFLSKPTLLMIQKIKGHLLQSLYHAGVIDVSAGGGVYTAPGRRRDGVVPEELNRNGDSLPLLTALIAIASQPKFAVRTGNMSYRTEQDKMVFIHPSSVNNRKRESEADPQGEKQLIAYAEKRQNVSTAGASAATAQKTLVTTTRLDPLTYILFGAYNITVTERGLECDDWLPIVGSIEALDDLQRLKYLMEACMLRVFEGITFARHRQQTSRLRAPQGTRRDDEKEDESDDDDDDENRDKSLTLTEIKEFDHFTQNIVRVLNRYADERIATQSRHNSRPGTPMGSPSFGLSALPSSGGGWRSGASTPFNISRAGTPLGRPSPLSRKW